jgi:hypothetical protein
MDPGYRHGGEALFFITAAIRLITWLTRTAREVQDDRSPGTTLASLMSPAMRPDQQARVMTMIADPPRMAEHRCPQCGTLIHADVVHGGFGPCRKCGWSPSPSSSPSS